MKKNSQHLIRAAMLLCLLVAGIIAVRQITLPKSFGSVGYFRGDNVQEWATRPLVHAEPQECDSCHAEKVIEWSQGAHKTANCADCHGPGEAHIAAPKDETLKVDGSRALCVGCHEKLAARPVNFPQIINADHNPSLACVQCHNPHSPALAAPPAIPHSLQGVTDCLQCHGTQGLKPVPADHADRTGDMCALCHKVEPKPTQDAGTAEGVPPRIPHDLAGRSDCLLCHGTGLIGAPVPPVNHTGITAAQCMLCHQPASLPEAAPTPVPTTVVSGPPAIPHTVEGRNDCLLCHSKGLLQAPTPPADHEGRTSDVCLTCHKQGDNQ